MPTPQIPRGQLRRVRWAVRCTLVLGVAASVAANVLHAQPNLVAQIIAAWPPLALLLAVELISRVPLHHRSLAGARLIATTAIAGIAAWVSYWHMAGVASRYGEQGASPFLLPLSVDGLVIVASVSLVELAGRIRAAESAQTSITAEAATHLQRSTVTVPAAVNGSVSGPDSARAATSTVNTSPDPTPSPAASPETTDPVHDVGGPATDAKPIEYAQPAGTGGPVDDIGHADIAESGQRGSGGRNKDAARTGVPASPTRLLDDQPPDEPRAAIAYWHAKDPALRPGEIAAKVGRSRSTVRRILAELSDTGTTNGDIAATASKPANTAVAVDRAPGGVNGKATRLAGRPAAD